MNKSVPPIQMVKKEDKGKKFDLKSIKSIYEFEAHLPGSGDYVRFKPFTTGQIKKILAFEGEENPVVISEMINTLLDEVILSEDIHVHDLFSRDREYLLLEIRNKTKGPKWRTEYKCQECKSQNILSVNLEELPTTRLVQDLVDFELKIMPTLTINMRFITVMDELEVLQKLDDGLTDTQKAAELAISMVASSIDSIIVNGKLIDGMTFEDKKYFLEELPTTIYHSLTEWLETNTYGTDFKIKNPCHSCGNILELDATPENFFF